MTGPDGTVRIAWSEDAPRIARLQLAEWRAAHPELSSRLPDEIHAVEAWRASLQTPGDARNRVLVAVENDEVRGLAVLTPAGDPDCDPIGDGELAELTVAAAHRGRGHGSRLLHAAAETLAADRFTRAVCWVDSTDDEARRFLTDAGWAPDGAHRELDLDGTGQLRVKQVRLHTGLH